MPVTIRKAAPQDAPAWLKLLQYTVGSDYPDSQVYDPAWAVAQLEENETWLAELNGRLECALSFLTPTRANTNPVANIGRHFHVDNHGLFDAPFPIPNADDAFDAEFSEKDLVHESVGCWRLAVGRKDGGVY